MNGIAGKIRPAAIGHAIFTTAIGFVGLAWSDRGLTRLCLPQASREAVERRMFRLEGSIPAGKRPQWVLELIDAIQAYATGEPVDFRRFPVDLRGMDAFSLAIYETARTLPSAKSRLTANWPNVPGIPAWHVKRELHWGQTQFPWSFPATASWRPAARSEVSPPRAERPPRNGFWPWRASGSGHLHPHKRLSVSDCTVRVTSGRGRADGGHAPRACTCRQGMHSGRRSARNCGPASHPWRRTVPRPRSDHRERGWDCEASDSVAAQPRHPRPWPGRCGNSSAWDHNGRLRRRLRRSGQTQA